MSQMIRCKRAAPISLALVAVIFAFLTSHLIGCADKRLADVNQDSKHPDLVVLARQKLSVIAITPEHLGDYRREDWPHWRPGRSRCISVREEVLISQSRTPVLMAQDGCSIQSGLWIDPYSGNSFTDPKRLDVDHLVPLEEANQSGGWAWSREKRVEFANDISTGFSLIAVSAEANRSKGSKGPEEWLPSNAAERCNYVVHWIMVKAKWELSVDQREHDSIALNLAACSSPSR